MSSNPEISQLEWFENDLQSWWQSIGAALSEFYRNNQTDRASDFSGSRRENILPGTDLTESGSSLREVLEVLFSDAMKKGINPTSPGFMAYIPTGGHLAASVGGLLGGALNRYSTIWEVGPRAAEIEISVIRWFGRLMGMPSTSGGFLTSGASSAMLSAIACARAVKLGDDFSKAVLYTSDQAHHCVIKATRLVGLRRDQIVIIPSDESYRLSVEKLELQIKNDLAENKKPFCLVASAGTTNTGAVDDLPRLFAVAEKYQLWKHVDAAYGGFFMLTEWGRALLKGLEQSDSICLDPHKGLFFPYGTGALLVRDPSAMRKVFEEEASYLSDLENTPDWYDFAHVSSELTRDSRGIRVWFSLKLFGIEAFRKLLEEKRQLILKVESALREIEGVNLVTSPELTCLTFQWAHSNTRTKALLKWINDKGRVFLSATDLKGQYVIRVCVLSFRTHEASVNCLAEDIAQGIQALS